jgi:hypothetical protein
MWNVVVTEVIQEQQIFSTSAINHLDAHGGGVGHVEFHVVVV